MGLRLRERRGTYSVELNQDGDAVRLRKRLDAAGIDTGTIEKTLNGGETIVPSPAVTILPSPLPHDAWEAAIFERSIRLLLGLFQRPVYLEGGIWPPNPRCRCSTR